MTGSRLTIDGLQIKGTESTNTTQGLIYLLGGGGTVVVQNCILQGYIKFAYGIITYSQNGDIIQNNVLISTNLGEGIYVDTGAAITSCTIVSTNSSSGAGIRNGGGNTVVKNTAVYGFGANDYQGTASASCTNNATDQASFGGTNYGGSGQTSLTGATEWQSVTNTSEDLRLKSTSAKLKDNGATAGPANDIAGTARPQGSAYDIGCWELVVAAAGAFNPFYYREHVARAGG